MAARSPECRETHVLLHALAPVKPEGGASCNGCGVCCADEPCPAARLALLQSHGRCRALIWDEERLRYVCGLVCAPRDFLSWLPAFLAPLACRFFARFISSGSGCDSDAQVD